MDNAGSDYINAAYLSQVRLSPTLEVYAQLSRPDGVREGSMPYTAWKCTAQSDNLSTGMKSLGLFNFMLTAFSHKYLLQKILPLKLQKKFHC